ncbi:branched-chain amino acid ABC transporter permease [Deinococcus sp. UYEF24]
MTLPTPTSAPKAAVWKHWPGLLALVLAALLPLALHGSNYLFDIAINALIFSIAAYGLNVILGYTGVLSLAHAGFFGIGAYAVGILTLKAGWNFWLAWPAATLICAVLGLLLGLLVFRTRGDAAIVLMLAVGVLITQVITKWTSLTGGVEGLIGIAPPQLLGLDFSKPAVFYYFALTALSLTIFLMARLRASLFGSALLGIRSSEDLARSAGINVLSHKLRAMMISTAVAGFAGGLYAVYVGYLGAAFTDPANTFLFVLYLLTGGVGTLAGPLIGTVLFRVMQQSLQGFQAYQYLIFGPLLVLLVIYFPAGLAGVWARLRSPRPPSPPSHPQSGRPQPATKRGEVPDAGL